MDTFREQLARLREMVARNERCFGRDIMIVPELCGDGISVTRLQREEIDALTELLRRWDCLDVHSCYRCGESTTLGTAWCQGCLDAAAEHKRRYPPKKTSLRPPRPGNLVRHTRA